MPEGNDAHIVIAGASGVIGAAALELFARLPGWRVTALSRRKPFVSEGLEFEHVTIDLRDSEDCLQKAAALHPVTHLIYAAVSEAPGLASGWRDEDLMAENGRMFDNLLDPLTTAGALQHVSIMQGAKAYGAHVHAVTVPLKEDSQRDDHPNFYWLHEDCLRDQAAKHGFAFTIFRPQVLMGTAPGAAMNPVAAIGAYAAICEERGLPFALPGESIALWEMVDADLLAEALAWAAISPDAARETFNVTNGDVFVLRHAWPELAAMLSLEMAGASPESFTAFFEAPENRAAWARIAAAHSLAVSDLDALLGQSHTYLDLLLGPQISAKTAPVLLSTIHIRQAGFTACRDSLTSLVHQLRRMVELKLLPPLGGLK